MVNEILTLLDPKPGDTVVDTTMGGGGHFIKLAAAIMPNGTAIGFDRDKRAHKADAAGKVLELYPNNVTLYQTVFSQIAHILQNDDSSIKIDCILADLGISSHQIDQQDAGFSFRYDSPIDMRMDKTRGITAYELIKNTEEEELANIIYEYGDERFSRRIAKAIKLWLSSNSTLELANIIARAAKYKSKRIQIQFYLKIC